MRNSEPGSAMDVSCTDEDYPPVSSKEDDGTAAVELGYQGWAARRLVRACHRIFVNENQQGGARNSNLITTSVSHRGVIYWCLSNINADPVSSSEASAAAASEADLLNEDVFHDGLTDFYHVWTLAEAFLLDTAPLPAAPLLRWLKMYSQSGEDEATRWELDETERVALEADALGGSADPTPAYWDALESLIVGVLPRRAAGMLRAHPEGRNNAGEVGAVARQLEKMPLLLPETAEGGDGAAPQLDREGFYETWTRWQKGCKTAAASFGFLASAGAAGAGAAGGGTGGGDERLRLRWLWGTLCGERGCLVAATDSWSGLFAAVLAFERPDMRKEEVASGMRECSRTHPHHQEEEFLLSVIRDSSSGAVESILRFARENGNTLALSACAAHLVDLLFRADQSSITHGQRRWFLRRLANRLKAFPCGGWELAAAYESGSVGGGDGSDDDAELLRDMARAVVPASEREAHALVEWCRVNGLGEEVAADVCRARGEAWTGKAGLSAEATGTADGGLGAQDGGDSRAGAADSSVRVPGACGKAAYWLSKGGGGVRLERLCAEVSERLMVEVSRRGAGDAGDDVEAQQAVLAEAEGVLAAVPPGPMGQEMSFLGRYKTIADILLWSPEEEGESMEDTLESRACDGGELAVGLLAPRDGAGQDLNAPGANLHTPPTRTWAHLIRLAVPVLLVQAESFLGGGGGGGGWQGEGLPVWSLPRAPVSAHQVHVLLAKMQALVASESRVGSERPDRPSTLPSAPASPYGFHGGRQEVLEIRRALVGCLGAAMMAQNAEETAPDEGGQNGWKATVGGGWGEGRLPAGALIVPRVDV